MVPEINGDVITPDDKIIANPNCSTIQMVMALAPLHKRFGIKRLVVSTYQSITGTGKKAVDQLMCERAGQPCDPAYPYPIDMNLFPHGGSFTEDRDLTLYAVWMEEGVKEFVIAFKHILPNIVSIIFVTLTLDFATCMLTESSLSYLGFGVTYPRPTWGNMLNGANNATVIKNFWWQWVFTSLFLGITCICINIIGDTLRDVMDPKSDRDK